MEKTIRKAAIRLSKEAVFILLTVISAVALPQILHTAGVYFGVGALLGQMLLPMYLPVMIIGFQRGIAPGAVAGFLAPIISFYMTGMPAAAILPYITVELVATGALAGAFAGFRIFPLFRVLSVQLAAKAVRLAVLASVQLYSSGTVVASALFAGILTSHPGVVIQLVLLTLLLWKRDKNNVR